MALDVFTFGETMLRLSPPGQQRLEQTTTLDMIFGGAESNVAVNLARLGKRVAWHSRLPDNPIGRQASAAIRKHGVQVDSVLWCPGERMGLYFIEFGTPPRGIQVWYDRADSAASRIRPEDLPLELLGSSRWLHVTGITPALSSSAAAAIQAAITYAREHQITVSFDVNYRARLWQPAVAAAALNSFCEQADYVFVALRDAVG
ncbi:MAG TPA: sugar kinase, partial [Phototrophicaceae bacterium]|nr:sugar kinase [Phototrophicaceae bacterium]